MHLLLSNTTRAAATTKVLPQAPLKAMEALLKDTVLHLLVLTTVAVLLSRASGTRLLLKDTVVLAMGSPRATAVLLKASILPISRVLLLLKDLHLGISTPAKAKEDTRKPGTWCCQE